MRKSLFIIVLFSTLILSCKPNYKTEVIEMNFDTAKASFYGDYYENGCANYVLSLVSGRYDADRNLVGAGYVLHIDLNLPTSNYLGLSQGTYLPLRSGMSPEFSFVRGGTSGSGELTGSYMLRFYGNEENGQAREVSDGKVHISVSSSRIVLDANLLIDGKEYSIHYKGDLVIYDETTPMVPSNPNLRTLNSAEASNLGQLYDGVNGDLWFLRLYDAKYESTGESVEIELITPVGMTSLPEGLYPIINNEVRVGCAVYGWVDEEDYVYGTWYCYGGNAWYGATDGTVSVRRQAGVNNYIIEFDCIDKIENNSFKGIYSGPVQYIDPSAKPMARPRGLLTKGDVLVSTASTRKGKHVGSRRLAR